MYYAHLIYAEKDVISMVMAQCKYSFESTSFTIFHKYIASVIMQSASSEDGSSWGPDLTTEILQW